MTDAIRIAVLLGSLRKGSYNAAIVRALPALAPEGMSFETVQGMGDLPIYNGDIEAEGMPQLVSEMAQRIRAADGVMIVTPEYNHSVPGGLKNMLDWLSRLKDQPFARKPTAIQSASQGAVGGARAQQDLRHVLAFLDTHTLNKPEVIIGRVQDKVNAQNELSDEQTRQFIPKHPAAFADFIRRLR